MKKKLLSMLVLLLTVTTGAWAQFSTSKGEVLSKSKAVRAFRAPIHKAPSQNDGWYYYDDGSYSTTIGTHVEQTTYWGILFPAESMDGDLLRKVSVYETSVYNKEPITIHIYSGGDTPNQGTLLYEETVETEHANAFHEIELQTPVSFNPAQNLWVVLSEDGDYPASGCANTGDANGGWIIDGDEWKTLANMNFNYTWMLRAYIIPCEDYKFTVVPAEHGSGTVKFYIGGKEVKGAYVADEGKTVTVKVTPDEGWIVDEDNVTAAMLYNNWENAGARRATDGEPANNVPIQPNIALTFVNKENGVWTFTFTQPASSVRISPKYLKVSTLYFNPADKTELMEVKVDGKVANPIQEGKITPVLENTPVNLKANRGYKFRKVEVKKAPFAANEYNKASWDGTKVVLTKKTAASEPTAVEDAQADVTWSKGWYTVSGNVTITGTVTLTADTHLILQDGAQLTINGQLYCNSDDGYNLYIYGQEAGDGKLNVSNSSIAIFGPNSSGKTIEIHGGEITATSTSAYGFFSYGIKMYGGKLTATSEVYPGISFDSGNFDVYGGEVEAISTGPMSACGIMSHTGTEILTVYGGKMKATGGTGINSQAIKANIKSGTSGIKFYFADTEGAWGEGTTYSTANTAPANRYAKAE